MHSKSWICVLSYKHDGSSHRFWDRGFVLEDNEDFIVIASKRTKVIESNGRKWHTKEPAVSIFSKKDWWNVICMFKEDGFVYYTNVASPSIVNDGLICYIDYDLDVKLYSSTSFIKTLDEKEYRRHKKLYQYSKDLDIVIRSEMNQIISLMQTKSFPFDDEKILNYYETFKNVLEKKEI